MLIETLNIRMMCIQIDAQMILFRPLGQPEKGG